MLKVFKKFNFLTIIIISMVAFSVFTGCDVNDELKNVDVYVGGHYMLGDNYYSCYWANGERTDVSKMLSSVDVYGDGNDVYAAASVKLPDRVIGKATYWKNGVAHELDSEWSATRDIVVRDGQVTILGYSFENDGGTITHWIWEDGIMTDIDGYAMSMAISGDDIYLAGMYSDDDRTPCYWINGNRYDLEADGLDLSGLIVRDIAVAGSDVYVVGRGWDLDVKSDIILFWKNGERIELDSENGEAYAVTTDGSDVYVAGQVGCTAAYWKNGNRTELGGDGCSYAMDIAVVGGNAYIAGHDAGTDKGVLVWKNKASQKAELDIPWAVSRSAYAHSIYVQPKN